MILGLSLEIGVQGSYQAIQHLIGTDRKVFMEKNDFIKKQNRGE